MKINIYEVFMMKSSRNFFQIILNFILIRTNIEQLKHRREIYDIPHQTAANVLKKVTIDQSIKVLRLIN